MKKALLLILFICFANTYAQNSLNDYKYVIVEKQFHFQTEPNQYNLNELTRFLLETNFMADGFGVLSAYIVTADFLTSLVSLPF